MPDQKKGVLNRLSGMSPQLYCLLAAGLMEFLFIVRSVSAYLYLDNYALIPCVLFAGMAIAQKLTLSAKRQLQLGLMVVIWFTILQTLHTVESSYSYPPGLFFSVYLLAFPFAAVTQDGARQKGLRMIAVIYLAASMLYLAFTGLLLVDHVPYFLEDFIYWDGARLRAMWHPNVCASIFMVGIAFCLGFFFQAKKGWVKSLLLVAVVLQFAASALTNSRTSVLMTCVLIGGIVFLCIYKGGWKRLLTGMLAALTIMVALFLSANALYKIHNDALIAKYTAQLQAAEAAEAAQPAAAESEKLPIVTNASTGEVTLQGVNRQSSFLYDLLTLNGRTRIWKTALRAIRDNPSILVFGTSHTGNTISAAGPYTVGHAHNSWLEILLGLGLPGFAAALIYSWIAIRNAFFVLFRGPNDMWKKSIAVLVLCLMVAGFLEPYLFYSDRYYPFFDFLFFLCCGYLTQWREHTA